jgi:hypothetical protein
MMDDMREKKRLTTDRPMPALGNDQAPKTGEEGPGADNNLPVTVAFKESARDVVCRNLAQCFSGLPDASLIEAAAQLNQVTPQALEPVLKRGGNNLVTEVDLTAYADPAIAGFYPLTFLPGLKVVRIRENQLTEFMGPLMSGVLAKTIVVLADGSEVNALEYKAQPVATIPELLRESLRGQGDKSSAK